MARRPSPRAPAVADTRDADVARAIESWFDRNARELPWRRSIGTVNGVPRRDPYRSLVSELMLQQTQVARVVERFVTFVERFPTVQDLARADVADVLALWSGLGYYRRARLLHAAAVHVATELGGVFPSDVRALREIPGIGPYTAGAIASMALGERVPLVDANVARVLLRLDLPPVADRSTGDKDAHAWAWGRAERLVGHAVVPGALNEGIMELGALVCTPAAPRCDACPLAACCAARATGRADSVPAPKRATRRGSIFAAAVLLRDSEGRFLLQQRPAGGMWGGLWQAPTLERSDRFPTSAEARAWLAGEIGAAIQDGVRFRQVQLFEHPTTHREVRFKVWECGWMPSRTPQGWRWVGPEELAGLGLSSAQQRVLTPVRVVRSGAASSVRGAGR
jgi:A/G-specific adenine glycosylase